jgi:hypothetical protein
VRIENMNRTTLKVTLLVISLLAFQFGLITPLAPAAQVAQPMPFVSAIQAPVGGVTPFSVNASDPYEILDIPILEPGVYRINLTCTVDSGLPAPGPDISVAYYQTAEGWMPQMGLYPMFDPIASTGWSNVPENDSRTYTTEQIAVNPGSFRIEFQIQGTSVDDQVSGTVAVSQELALSTLPLVPAFGVNTTLTFTQDNTWMGLRMSLPIHDLYNLTVFSEMDWSTTGGWGGSGGFMPFSTMEVMDQVHGDIGLYGSWLPSFFIPSGADTNSTTYGPIISRYTMEAGVYYLLGKSGVFEFLNGSFVDFTFNIAPVPTQILTPGIPLQLSFNTTPNVYDTYVAVTIPEGHYFKASFSNPIGHNWSVMGFDAWTGSTTGPYYETYEDPTLFYTDKHNLERGWVTGIGNFAPQPGMLGDPYFEYWQADATYVVYVNGTKVLANPPSGGAMSYFNTFYFRAQAFPVGTPSPTFELTVNVELTPFPGLTLAGLTFNFNSTFGPYYHFFQLPQASGTTYEVSALPTSYSTTGTVHIEDTPQSMEYEDWQWNPMFIMAPIAVADPPYGMGAPASRNTNDSATLTYVAVKNGINYLWVLGPGYPGMPGDMNETTVSLTVTLPMPYALGSPTAVSMIPGEFYTYTFNLEAGVTYYLELSMRSDGAEAYGTFFNGFGYSPFMLGSLFDFFIGVGPTFPFGPVFRTTFTARTSGPVTFVVSAETAPTTVDFIITGIYPWFSLTMIAALGLTAILMVVIGILVGYFLAKRRFRP